MNIRIPALSAAALAVLLLTPAAPAFAQEAGAAFTQGVAAYEDGDYAAAAELWAPLAEDGNIEAMRNLAQLYRLGLGVEQDNERAYTLYKSAAEENSVEAQVNTAFLLLTGEGTRKDPQQAAIWFARAADQGDALAQFNLGLMYEKGVGVEQDRETARELYELAANQGQRRALARLDALESQLPPDGGENTRRNRDQEQRDAERRSLEQQDRDLERVRGRAQEKADAERDAVEEQEREESETGPVLKIERSDKKDADTEDASAETPTKLPPPPPLPKPKKAEKPAAAPTPQKPVASAPVSGPVAQVRRAEAAYAAGDFRTAARLLIPLARNGMPIAQFWMGRMFNRGEGVQLNRLEAFHLWRLAAQAGSDRAMTALANLSNRLSPEELAQAEAYHRSKLR